MLPISIYAKPKGLTIYKLQEIKFSRTFAGCMKLDQYGIPADMTRGQHAV